MLFRDGLGAAPRNRAFERGTIFYLVLNDFSN